MQKVENDKFKREKHNNHGLSTQQNMIESTMDERLPLGSGPP